LYESLHYPYNKEKGRLSVQNFVSVVPISSRRMALQRMSILPCFKLRMRGASVVDVKRTFSIIALSNLANSPLIIAMRRERYVLFCVMPAICHSASLKKILSESEHYSSMPNTTNTPYSWNQALAWMTRSRRKVAASPGRGFFPGIG
jgi:hypothetical protein